MAAAGGTAAGGAEASKLVITAFGGFDKLQVQDDVIVAPKAGEVQVAIKAAGVNFAELMARMGVYPTLKKAPAVIGYEASGVVQEVGEGVTDFAPGDRVVVVHGFELFKTHVTFPQEYLFKMPAGMTFAEGAAIPVQYVTASMMLDMGGLAPGKSVLVHMAAGGVGTAVCQICKAMGDVTVYGTCSAGKHDYARSQGCTVPIDYKTQDYSTVVKEATGGKGVDIVLDPLGGPDIAKNYELVAPLGKQVLYGASNYLSGSGTISPVNALSVWWNTAKLDVMTLMQTNRTVAGFHLGLLVHEVSLLKAAIAKVMAQWEAGDIKPNVDRVFSFAKAGAAHKYMTDRKNKGKLLLAWEPLEASEVPEGFTAFSQAPTGDGDFVLAPEGWTPPSGAGQAAESKK